MSEPVVPSFVLMPTEEVIFKVEDWILTLDKREKSHYVVHLCSQALKFQKNCGNELIENIEEHIYLADCRERGYCEHCDSSVPDQILITLNLLGV